MWMVYYFLGSMIAAVLSLQFLKVLTAPFFMVKSLFTSRLRSSSGHGRR